VKTSNKRAIKEFLAIASLILLLVTIHFIETIHSWIELQNCLSLTGLCKFCSNKAWNRSHMMNDYNYMTSGIKFFRCFNCVLLFVTFRIGDWSSLSVNPTWHSKQKYAKSLKKLAQKKCCHNRGKKRRTKFRKDDS